MPRKLTRQLISLAREVASETKGFLDSRGPGHGNHTTNGFMRSLRERAIDELGRDFSERKISGPNSLAVDFYIPAESTVIEVALGLKRPNSEFEKDILKAVMAQQSGSRVDRLVFIGKPGAKKKCEQPGRLAMKQWAYKNYGISIEVFDLVDA